MTLTDAIKAFNSDFTLFVGTKEGWQAQHGDDWRAAFDAYVADARVRHNARNKKYGTTGRLIIPDFEETK